MGEVQTLLKAPMLKVQRAEHHTNDLEARVSDYLERRPFRLMTSGEPKKDQQTHFFRELEPIPDEFGIILGDAIHNLRSSLDLLIFSMIGERALKPESVKFPFAKRQESLARVMKDGEINLAGEEVEREIRDLEPYPGGSKWLNALHSLDIADKHRIIIPAASTGTMNSLDFARMLPGITGYETVEVVLSVGSKFINGSNGSRVARLANRKNIRPGVYERDLQPAFEIVFAEDQPLAQQPIVPTMRSMIQAVVEVLSRLANAYAE